MLIVRTLPTCAPPAPTSAARPAPWRWCRPWAPCTRAIAPWCASASHPAPPPSPRSSSIRCSSAPLRTCRATLAMRPANLAALQAEGCALVWLPDVVTMYPVGEATTISVAGPAERWEGRCASRPFPRCRHGLRQAVRPGPRRPGLFRREGLAATASGEADGRRSAVVAGDRRRPTVREPDGLAMSSRNRFLSPAERATAPVLYATLRETVRAIAGGAPVADALTTCGRRHWLGPGSAWTISRWWTARASPRSIRCGRTLG